MPASEAMIGYGTLFAVEGDDSPGTYTSLGEVFNVTPPNEQVDQVDVTHNASPDRTREFIAGLIDPGEASFEMNFIPNSASDERIREMKADGDVRSCRITFPNSVVWTFLASVVGYEITAATEDKMTATVTMRVSGPTTVTP